jgi:2-dehydropantoate 2-reductase
MKVVIMGAGAIGGFYGVKLARAGEEVTFIARGEQLRALRERGLTVERDEETFTLHPLRATDNPAEAGVADLVLMTIKSYDLERACESIRPLIGPETLVLPLLNGVDIAERMGRVLGMAHLLSGQSYVPARVTEPGVIRQPGAEGTLIFGEPVGGPSPRSETLCAALRRAGIPAEVAADIRTELWKKFVLVAPNGGVGAVTGFPMGAVRSDPDTRALVVAAIREVEAVARAQGIDLGADVCERVLGFVDSVPPWNKPSMLQDLERGKPMELETLQGTLVRLGRELGVPTPVNGLIYTALKLRARGRS